MKVQRETTSHVVRDYGFVHVQRALWTSRGSTGEMQQGRIVRVGRLDQVIGRCLADRLVEVDGSGRERRRFGFRHDQDVLERGQALTQSRNLLCIERCRRNQHLCFADLHAGVDRFRSERRKQWAGHTARLERAQHGYVQLRDTAGKHEHPFPLSKVKVFQDIGEPVSERTQLEVAEVADFAIFAQPPDRQLA